MVMTWAMPVVFRSRGRTTQSASVRSESWRWASEGKVTSRDTPATEARTFCEPSGSTAAHRGAATGTDAQAAGLRRSVGRHA